MMLCSRCGTEIQNGEKFCKGCGSQILMPQNNIQINSNIQQVNNQQMYNNQMNLTSNQNITNNLNNTKNKMVYTYFNFYIRYCIKSDITYNTKFRYANTRK